MPASIEVNTMVTATSDSPLRLSAVPNTTMPNP